MDAPPRLAAAWRWAAIWRCWLRKQLQQRTRLTAAGRGARAVLRTAPGRAAAVLPARGIPVAQRILARVLVMTQNVLRQHIACYECSG
jgi:hypothetical protein